MTHALTPILLNDTNGMRVTLWFHVVGDFMVLFIRNKFLFILCSECLYVVSDFV